MSETQARYTETAPLSNKDAASVAVVTSDMQAHGAVSETALSEGGKSIRGFLYTAYLAAYSRGRAAAQSICGTGRAAAGPHFGVTMGIKGVDSG